jgi:hypothetical protein
LQGEKKPKKMHCSFPKFEENKKALFQNKKGHVHTKNITFSKHNNESKTFKKHNKNF